MAGGDQLHGRLPPPPLPQSVQYITIQYSTVHYKHPQSVQYSTVQTSTVSTVQYSTNIHSQYSTVQYNTVQNAKVSTQHTQFARQFSLLDGDVMCSLHSTVRVMLIIP